MGITSHSLTTFAGWVPLANPCTLNTTSGTYFSLWNGVTCNLTSPHVQKLNLFHQSMVGTVSTEIGLLSQLVQLFLTTNSLFGTIPTQLAQLTNLAILDLDLNNFSGTLPSIIFASLHASLRQFYCMNSVLNGTLPSELGLATSLQIINLPYNAFTGQIPSELGRLTALSIALFQGNKLTGTVPTQVNAMCANLIPLQGYPFDCNLLQQLQSATPGPCFGSPLTPCVQCPPATFANAFNTLPPTQCHAATSCQLPLAASTDFSSCYSYSYASPQNSSVCTPVCNPGYHNYGGPASMICAGGMFTPPASPCSVISNSPSHQSDSKSHYSVSHRSHSHSKSHRSHSHRSHSHHSDSHSRSHTRSPSFPYTKSPSRSIVQQNVGGTDTDSKSGILWLFALITLCPLLTLYAIFKIIIPRRQAQRKVLDVQMKSPVLSDTPDDMQ